MHEPYWFTTVDLPSTDFSRELVPPGSDPDFPDGVVGMRVDDNFWAVAALPWSYRDKTIQEIVAELWPDVKNPEFGHDYVRTSCTFLVEQEKK